MRFSLAVLLSILLLGTLSSADQWLDFGRDRFLSRSTNQNIIRRGNVGDLQLKWTFNASSDVSATPTVLGGVVYFSDFGGSLWALNASTGGLIWTRSVPDITGIEGDYSRAAPILIPGRDVAIYSAAAQASCYIFALKRSDGSFLWKTRVETHPAAWLTGTPGYYQPRDLVIIGTSSIEGSLALDPSYPCCSFRGAYVALSALTGVIRWKTYMVPENYSGAPSWGAGISYDDRGNIFVATGQGYKAPEEVNQCLYGQTNTRPHLGCLPKEVMINSIVALRARDGKVSWSYRSAAPDFFTLACILIGNVPNCNNPPGTDMDFSMNPMLVSVGPGRELVVALSKAGVVFALNSRNGKLVWSTVIGPGANANGFYGGAFDKDGIYLVAPNARKYPWILHEKGKPTGEITVFSLITRLRARDGRIEWQVPDRHPNLFDGNTVALPTTTGQFGLVMDTINGKTTAPLTVSNGVLYTCTMSAGGTMYALDTRNGKVLWSHPGNEGSCNSGPSLVDGRLYWGSGYGRLGLGTPDNRVYSFGL